MQQNLLIQRKVVKNLVIKDDNVIIDIDVNTIQHKSYVKHIVDFSIRPEYTVQLHDLAVNDISISNTSEEQPRLIFQLPQMIDKKCRNFYIRIQSPQSCSYVFQEYNSSSVTIESNHDLSNTLVQDNLYLFEILDVQQNPNIIYVNYEDTLSFSNNLHRESNI